MTNLIILLGRLHTRISFGLLFWFFGTYLKGYQKQTKKRFAMDTKIDHIHMFSDGRKALLLVGFSISDEDDGAEGFTGTGL